MALIDCPACNKKISDKSKLCQHCGVAVGALDADDIRRKASLKKTQQLQSVNTQSIIAILMIAGGAWFALQDNVDKESLEYQIAVGAAVGGFFWAIVNRVRIVFIKRK
ncbi:zinc ribbon domain-containing protein [Neptunicella marina]|uniref:Zinc ribbon domain-containing protein n=1 Tax=Neptunicella marina TaxID=2125989 RepID=A0A8J6IXI5_9ALTE|nr:zinc ribbon domain-containing protein [Neptunicella marina]MBC3767292.1 zinc ribbon domain-containing protein [Neptunicella marina]